MLSRLRSLASPKLSSIDPIVTEPLHYAPLKTTTSIRLIHISPGNPNDRISCTLVETPLAEAPSYKALSYTWGNINPDVAKTIVCNGQLTSVSPNLSTALCTIRHPNVETIFWIDQLSIDQNNISERSNQVALMGRIYTQASLVVVWLGSADSNSKTGIALAQRILEVVGDRDHYHLTPDVMESVSLPPYKDKRWRALGAFLRRAWFSRVWIIQEAVMASDAVFMCGQDTFAMEEIFKLVDRLSYLSAFPSFAGMPGSGNNGVWCGAVIQRLRKTRETATLMSSVELLGTSTVCSATDPRDKIFAMLELGRFGIEADYSKSVEEVYTGYAVTYLSKILPPELSRLSPKYLTDPIYSTFVARLLVWAHSTDSKLDMPSWVPDWSHFPITSFAGVTSAFYDPKGVQIPSSPDQDEKYRSTEITILPNNNALRMSSKLFDTITTIGTQHIDLRKNSTPSSALYTQFTSWYAETSVLVSLAPPIYPTGISWQEAYKRTLAMDNIGLASNPEHRHPSAQHLEWSHGALRQWNRTSSLTKFLAGGEQNEAAFWQDALKICGRVFFLTEKGYIGLAPYGSQKGDRIVTLLAIRTPFVVREEVGRPGSYYRLIGSCYVHGLMDGEIAKNGEVSFEPITLV